MTNEVSRRTVIVDGLAMLGLTAFVSVRAIRQTAEASETAPGVPNAVRAFLDAYADTLIPDTDTPGAKSVGAPAFVELMMSHTPDPKDLAKFQTKLDLIRAEFDKRAGASFAQLDAARRAQVLEAFDRDVLTGKAGHEYALEYGQLRSVTLYAYYTSEVGATQELRYQLVPGRYDADIPFDPHARAYSNFT